MRNTIEFILSIHPSTGNAKDTSKSQGANVSLQALSSASKLISSPPSGMLPEDWFSGIAPQLFALLDGEGGLEMVKASAYIIGYGVLGRREYGVPGTAGWKAFAEPLLSAIHPSLAAIKQTAKSSSATVIDLTIPRLLVSSSKLAEALRRLSSLISSHPNPALSKRLLGKLLLPLWSMFSWPCEGTQFEEWRAPAGYLLQILLQLSDVSRIEVIMDNLTFIGMTEDTTMPWQFRADTGGIYICIANPTHGDGQRNGVNFKVLDAKVDAFIALLQQTKDGEAIPALFLDLCRTWLSSTTTKKKDEILITAVGPEPSPADDSEKQLVHGKVMQAMIEKLPEKLIANSIEVLQLANDVLAAGIQEQNLENDDSAAVALSLLNIVFTSPSFNQTNHETILASIQQSLQYIQKQQLEISNTARNLLFLLQYQKTEPPSQPSSNQDTSLDEDRRLHKLALSYLTTPDSPPPVLAQGLDIITTLIRKNTPILDIPSTLILLQTLLQDPEEYIYLHCIKALTALSTTHPKATIKSILETYTDLNEDHNLDIRLRTGEALHQIFEDNANNKPLTVSLVSEVYTTLLHLSSRRPLRPKTASKAEKADQLAAAKEAEFSQAWDGIPDKSKPEMANEDEAILSEIITGWSGSRSHEDLRIRTSSLTLMGTLLRQNISSLPTHLISSTIDTSLHILTLEPSPSASILRRAAMLLIMDLIKTLDEAAEEGKKLGFGLVGKGIEDVMNVLKYVHETDCDGLVKQHASDVIESLEIWRVKGLVVGSGSDGGGMLRGGLLSGQGGLAGLGVNLKNVGGSGTRPKIEEIE